MWLNMLILSIASIAVGFILGWIVALPKRWDRVAQTGPAQTPAPASTVPAVRVLGGSSAGEALRGWPRVLRRLDR